MPRIQDYEEAKTLTDQDSFLIDQEGKTKTVKAETVKKAIGGGGEESGLSVELEE